RRHTRCYRDWSSDVCSSDLHDDTARKIRTARSATPSAPTPALAVIDSRLPSGGLNDACEPYHALPQPSIHSRGSCDRTRGAGGRSEERRVGKEGRARWVADN